MRILVIDDDDLERQGVHSALAADSSLSVRDADSVSAAIQQATILRPNVVLVGAGILSKSGLHPLREIRNALPCAQIILLGEPGVPNSNHAAPDAESRSDVPESVALTDLIPALRQLIRDDSAAPAEHRAEHRPALESPPSPAATSGDTLRELSLKLLRTQDEERRRIARELHDGIGQLLVAMSMNLSKLEDLVDRSAPEARQLVGENIALIGQASQEIRTVSHLLHPPLLDEVGLESALRWYVGGFAERSNISVTMSLADGFSKYLPRDLSLSLFRIVQECLTNIHRHSESHTAWISIDRTSREIQLEVRDEGHGVSPEIQQRVSAGEISGLGLRGMRERIRQFEGRFDFHSDRNGTRILVILPLPEVATNQEKTPLDGGNDSDIEASAFRDKAGAATILCIDDEAAGLLPRRLLLESAGYRVLAAHSGAEGIQLFQSERIDAVILDYWMSGMKGTAVAGELKRINPAVPIVVLSGMSDLPGEAAGIVDQWVVKGTHRAEVLLDTLTALLDRRPP